ncbi:MAG: septal ring lytic transglycosylase RlpA family protein [bacterium]
MNTSRPYPMPLLISLLLCVTLTGCSVAPRFATQGRSGSAPSAPPPQENKEEVSAPVVKNPGKVLLTLEGIASYYADEFHGRQTSNGEVYDKNALTAAHRTFPFGTLVRVTNLEQNLSTIVRVNDRGPFKEGRLIDLSEGAAKELGMIQKGTARVKLEVLEWGRGQ